MKSRLLTTAAAMFLLLGLVSNSAFAQLSSSSSVNFFIKSYEADGDMAADWHDWNSAGDTVGRKMDVLGQWTVGSQSLPTVTYTLTLPAGTVMESTVVDSIFLYIYDGSFEGPRQLPSGTAQVVQVTGTDVSVDLNPIASYSSTKAPTISVTSTVQRSQTTTFQIRALKGINIGKIVTDINSSSNRFMEWSFGSTSQAGTTFTVDDSLRVRAGNPEGVTFNTGIGGYIDSGVFSSVDTLVFVDIFGNLIPAGATMRNVAGDGFIITAAVAGGVFDTAYVHAGEATTAGVYGNVALSASADSVVVTSMTASSDVIATGYGGADGFVHDSTNATTGVDYSMIVLGGSAATTAGLGLAFDATTGETSTTFYIRLTAGTGQVLAHQTVLGVTPDSVSSVTRSVLPVSASEQIGSLSVTYNDLGITYVGGKLNGELDITIKNIFGENFADASVIGTDTDPVSLMFFYQDSNGVNTTETGYLTSGKTVSSKYTMPAATFDNTNSANDHISGASFALATIGNTNGGASQFSIEAANTNLPVYFGYASHGISDSIGVVVYATNDATKRDTFMIKVEPGSPVAFDLDAFSASLAAKVPVKGLAIDTSLPIIALDTSYNRVSNLLLGTATTFLDAIGLQSTGGADIKAINFLVDGRDPKGHASATVKDSLLLDYVRAGAWGAGTLDHDSSFVGNTIVHAVASEDSAIINLGGTGDDPLSLTLNFTGNNRRVSMVFDPMVQGTGYDPASRTIDLGLFSLLSPTVVDSLKTPTVAMTAKAGRTDTMTITVALPIATAGDSANVLDQNSADSLFILTLENFGDAAGLPAGLTTASIQVSADNLTYYSVGGVYQGAGDSVAFSTPITFNATSVEQTMYIKLYGVINPTVADSANLYKVKLATSATPIFATKAVTFSADTLAQYLLVSPTADQDTVRAGIKWLSYIAAGDAVDTLTVGDTAWFQIVVADQYGNVLGGSAGNNLSANKLLLTSVDSTSTGNSLDIIQKYAGVNRTVGAGTQAIDSLAAGYIVKTAAGYADSVAIVAASTNGGVDYDLMLTDTTGAVTGSMVKVYVKAGAASAIALDPDTLVTGNRGVTLPTITATLTDSYGNAVVGGSVSFGLAVGEVAGAFADTNTVALAVGVDTVAVSTDAAGKAMASWTAASSGDSVNIAVWTTGVSAVTFRAMTQFTDTEGAIRIVSPTDSLIPSLTDAGTIVANVLDADLVVAVYANVWRSELTAGTDGVIVTSDAVAYDSVVGVAVASLDSAQVSLVLPDTVAVDTATVIKYQLVMVDAVDSVTYGDTMMYVVAPNRGKRDMTANAVNVADVMRLVYLIAIDEIVPTIVDYLGLDLDQDGTFDTPDLTAELAIWKGTGTMLAGAASLENATAKAALSYEATDKASANLAVNLESSHNLNVAKFQIKYDTKKFVFGEVKATDRLKNVVVVSGANENDGIFTVVLVNTDGGPILQGSGAIINIEIRAVGDKFDGVGEISLLNASFDDGVSAELSREILSPKALLPKAFALSQNYPNPFNPSTTIAYDVPEGDNVQVQLNVYNMRGQLVKTLVNDSKGEGSYQVQWDGSDNYGRRVSSGVFFYRIKAGEFSKTRKMVILK